MTCSDTPEGKLQLQLKLHGAWVASDVEVVHVEHGTPVPFTVVDFETLEVDEHFFAVAVVRRLPRRKS